MDHGAAWPVKIVGHEAPNGRERRGRWWTPRSISPGGYGIFAASGMERLFRDARLARIHPANSALTHEVVAKLTLGIDPDARPRWG